MQQKGLVSILIGFDEKKIMRAIKMGLVSLTVFLLLFVDTSLAANVAREVDRNTRGEDLFQVSVAKHIEGEPFNRPFNDHVEEKYFQYGVSVKWLFNNRAEGLEVVWDNQNKVAKVCRNGQELLFNCSGRELQLKENQFLMPQEYVFFENNQVYFNPLWLQVVLDDFFYDTIVRNEEFNQFMIEELEKLGLNDTEKLLSLHSRLNFLGVYETGLIYPNGRLPQYVIYFVFEHPAE